MLTAQHIPCTSNCVVDTESRKIRDRTDWKLNPLVFNRINEIFRTLEIDLFASLTDPPTATILHLETEPTGRGNRRLSTELGNPEGVCQPSLVRYGESSQSSDGAESPGSPGGSSLEGPVMVSGSSRYTLGVPTTDSSSSRSLQESSRAGSTGADHPASRVAYLRKKFNDSSFSEEALRLLLASWRTKSNQSYDSHFRKWLGWCLE